MKDFIEERAKLVRSLADKADPFIKRRLLALAERYEERLTPASTTKAVQQIQLTPTFTIRGSGEN